MLRRAPAAPGGGEQALADYAVERRRASWYRGRVHARGPWSGRRTGSSSGSRPWWPERRDGWSVTVRAAPLLLAPSWPVVHRPCWDRRLTRRWGPCREPVARRGSASPRGERVEPGAADVVDALLDGWLRAKLGPPMASIASSQASRPAMATALRLADVTAASRRVRASGRRPLRQVRPPAPRRTCAGGGRSGRWCAAPTGRQPSGCRRWRRRSRADSATPRYTAVITGKALAMIACSGRRRPHTAGWRAPCPRARTRR